MDQDLIIQEARIEARKIADDETKCLVLRRDYNSDESFRDAYDAEVQRQFGKAFQAELDKNLPEGDPAVWVR